jgi:hypothetical protein
MLCDVVFDEPVFPFSKLHPNIGILLRSEILVLPPTLRNLCGSMHLDVANMPDVANPNLPACASANVPSSSHAEVPCTRFGAHAGTDARAHVVIDYDVGDHATVDSHADASDPMPDVAGSCLAVNATTDITLGAHAGAGARIHAIVDAHEVGPTTFVSHA